ncbi:MAG: LysR family transcriptional regulator [Pseudomonadota bacterium]|nr:LysR family transcriptional regulator [Pseudomonadota bacterium]
MSRLELRHLATLVALRDAGSLVDAAERVNLTQSALSHQLKALEERLGTPLFERKSRPVRFTPAGARLLAAADRILPELAAAERDLARLAGGATGRLFMALDCHSCFDWLLPAIEAYRDRRPDIELDLSTAFGFNPLPALLRGDLDLVITSDPVAQEGITYVPLFRYEAVLAVKPGHLLTREEPLTPEAVAAYALITYPVDLDRLYIYTRFFTPAGVAPDRRRTAELTPMIVQLVASGRGVACLPNWALAEYVERGLVTALSLGEDGVWPVLYAAIRSEEAETPFMTAFCETAVRICFERLVGIRPAPEVSLERT